MVEAEVEQQAAVVRIDFESSFAVGPVGMAEQVVAEIGFHTAVVQQVAEVDMVEAGSNREALADADLQVAAANSPAGPADTAVVDTHRVVACYMAPVVAVECMLVGIRCAAVVDTKVEPVAGVHK